MGLRHDVEFEEVDSTGRLEHEPGAYQVPCESLDFYLFGLT